MGRLISFYIIASVTSILCHEIENVGALTDEQKENAEAGESCASICSSSECENVANNLIENMDPTVDPCDNFYQFVCGNFIKKHKLHKNKISHSPIDVARRRTTKQLIDVLNSEILPTDIEAFKKMKIYYKNCLDEDEIDTVGVEPLMSLLNRLGGWPVLLGDEWEEETYKLEDLISSISKEGFDPDFPFSLYLWIDDSNDLSINLYYTNDPTNAGKGKSIKAYKSYAVDIAVLLGADRERAIAEMNDMIEFEQKLNKTRNLIYSPSRKPIDDMSKEMSDLPWLDIVNALLSPINLTATGDTFVAYDPKWISDLGSLINSTPKRVVANYLIYQIIDRLMLFLPEEFRTRKILFHSKLFRSKELLKRENICLNMVKSGFNIAITSMYVRNYFNQQPKTEINELIENIHGETKASLKQLDWMDYRTRKEALEKLGSMKILVAYPNELIDDKEVDGLYDDLEIIVGQFLDNVQKTYAHAKNIKFIKFNNSTRGSDWISDVFGVTKPATSYYPGKNQINVYAGILQEPFFNSHWPNYLNYGGIGHIIGHEIIHGFDSRGQYYDNEGNSAHWWTHRTTYQFEKKVRCKIDEYNNYTIKQINQKIDGKQTELENVADAGGIKIAYNAYKKSIESKGATEDCLPNLNYSPEKLFWINAATIHCHKMTDEYLRQLLVRKLLRSPSDARVNVVFADNEDFAKDFECPVGSTMNPIKKCQVW